MFYRVNEGSQVLTRLRPQLSPDKGGNTIFSCETLAKVSPKHTGLTT